MPNYSQVLQDMTLSWGKNNINFFWKNQKKTDIKDKIAIFLICISIAQKWSRTLGQTNFLIVIIVYIQNRHLLPLFLDIAYILLNDRVKYENLSITSLLSVNILTLDMITIVPVLQYWIILNTCIAYFVVWNCLLYS